MTVVDPQQAAPPRAEHARTWRRYLRFFGPRGAADLDDELRFHVEMRVGEYMACGMTEAEARAATAHRLGNLATARETCVAITTRRERRMTRTQLIDHFVHDMRFAVRSLGRNKGWTAVAILTLAVGIGANSAMFSVVNHLLLNPLSYPNADRIAALFLVPTEGAPKDQLVMVTPDAKLVEAWRDNARSLEALEPYATTDVLLERGAGTPALARVGRIRPSFGAFAGQRPIVGRLFTDQEATDGVNVGLLAEGTWRARFGADRALVGGTLRVNGTPVTIIGVMPDALALPRTNDGDVDLWMPIDPVRDEIHMRLVARLSPGVLPDAAQRELDAIAAGAQTSAVVQAGYNAKLMAPAEMVSFKDSLVLLSAAVALVLLIACANVMHLLLARAAARQRELAIRSALGAGTGRLFRQLLTESLLLSFAGCLGGIVVGWAALRALVAARPQALADLASVRMDGSTLLLTAAIAVATGLLFGVTGAIHAARHSTNEALKAGALATSGSRRRGRARSLLVVSEMALCTVLLVSAGLLLRSVSHLRHKDIGFDPRGLYTLEPRLPAERYTSAAAKVAFRSELVKRVRAMPGVDALTLASAAPLSTTYLLGALQRDGDPDPPAGTTALISYNSVASNYFTVMGIRIVQGTNFTDTTAAGAQAIVNEGMAQQLWPDGSAIGRRVRVVYGGSGDWKTIVGVAANASTVGVTRDANVPMLYGAHDDASFFSPALLVRASGGAPVVQALTGIAAAVDPLLPPPRVQAVEDAMRSTMARPRFTMLLLGIFAAVAVALAAVGLYGVLAYNVAQRTREIGIRMALGASRRRVAREILSQGLLMVVLGAVAGLVAARLGTKLLAHTLYGVQQTDPLAFAGGTAVLIVIAVLACVVPVRRALAVDPQIAMRAD
ncbi:MAG: ABC transporter permease [Gemmatimonadaceae bacterium]